MRVAQWLGGLVLLIVATSALSPFISGYHAPVYAQTAGIKLASGTCTAPVSVVTPTATVAVSSGGLSLNASQTVRVLGVLNVTAGAGTTAFTVKIVRGTSASGTALVTPTIISATAGATTSYTIGGEDTPGEVSGQQYAVVIQPTGATAAGSVLSCEMIVAAF